jgi:hypothetical protein
VKLYGGIILHSNNRMIVILNEKKERTLLHYSLAKLSSIQKFQLIMREKTCTTMNAATITISAIMTTSSVLYLLAFGL